MNPAFHAQMLDCIALPLCVITNDANCTIVYTNKAFNTQIMPSNNISTLSFVSDIIRTEDLNRFLCAKNILLSTGTPIRTGPCRTLVLLGPEKCNFYI